MHRKVEIALLFLALFILTGCKGDNPNTRPAAVLPFEELPREVGFRRYDYADAGLENVLGFSKGHIEEVLTIGDQIMRFYYDESDQLLVTSWGFPSQGEDIILADGAIVSNCCYNDGAERVYMTRKTADGGLERGSFDIDSLIRDPEVDYRSIIERYDLQAECFLVTRSRHDIPVRQENPPVDSVRIEIEDLASLKYEAYSPDPESASRLIEARQHGSGNQATKTRKETARRTTGYNGAKQMADNTVSLILKELALIPCEHMVKSLSAETSIAVLYEGIAFIIAVDNRNECAHTVSISAVYPLKTVDPSLYRALNNQRFISLSMGLSVFEHGKELCFMYKLPEWIRDEDIGTACRQALEDLLFTIQFWDITYFQSVGEQFRVDDLPAAQLKERIKRRRAFKTAIQSLPPIDVSRD